MVDFEHFISPSATSAESLPVASGDNPVATNLLEPHYEVKAIQHGEKGLHDRTPLLITCRHASGPRFPDVFLARGKWFRRPPPHVSSRAWGRNTVHEAAIRTGPSEPPDPAKDRFCRPFGAPGRNLSELSGKLQRIAAAG
jgi:hypothetical protein